MEQLDCVVIGAGVIGLAVARALALDGREVVVLEAASLIGSETSSRNSEVIHAGIYYPTNSLKARLCVAGKIALYRYCEERGIAHARLGKLIVATADDQIPTLQKLREQAHRNDVDDVEFVDLDTLRRMEPELTAVAALHSPSTGIIDSHEFMLSLQGDAENAGAILVLNTPLIGGRIEAEGIVAETGGPDPMTFRCNAIVNCAGLNAPGIAARIVGLPRESIPQGYYAKGNYYTLSGRNPFRHLIYPVPVDGGLGVHVTIDLGGQARFGPDVEWIDEIDYDVDPTRAEEFYGAVRQYWPGLQDGSIQPGYAGIRPKLSPPGSPAADFVIQGQSEHGVPGLVNLYGIESPGLTASLAIAEEVAAKLHSAL